MTSTTVQPQTSHSMVRQQSICLFIDRQQQKCQIAQQVTIGWGLPASKPLLVWVVLMMGLVTMEVGIDPVAVDVEMRSISFLLLDTVASDIVIDSVASDVVVDFVAVDLVVDLVSTDSVIGSV